MARPRLILIKGVAGLGNRLLALLTGLLYAELTHRTLAIDWTDGVFANRGENAFTNLFDLSDGDHLSEICSASESICPAIWRGHLTKSHTELIQTFRPDLLGHHSTVMITSVDVTRFDYPDDILILWTWDEEVFRILRATRAFGPSTAVSDAASVLQTLAKTRLKLRPSIEQAIDAFRRANWTGRMIGVHVRHTDRRVPTLKFHRAVSKLLRENAGATIFLATDSAGVQAEFIDQYPRVVVTQKTFSKTGAPLHRDPETVDKASMAVDAIVEMYLLASCNALVYSRRSTFSYMSRLLSGLPETQVIDVDRNNLAFRTKHFLQRHVERRWSVSVIGKRLGDIFDIQSNRVPHAPYRASIGKR